jgi:hypothetical protein
MPRAAPLARVLRWMRMPRMGERVGSGTTRVCPCPHRVRPWTRGTKKSTPQARRRMRHRDTRKYEIRDLTIILTDFRGGG